MSNAGGAGIQSTHTSIYVVYPLMVFIAEVLPLVMCYITLYYTHDVVHMYAVSFISNFTLFFYFTPVVLDLCLAILRKYPSNTKCNPLLSDIIDNLITELDSEIEKDVATHSTTDDGVPLTSLMSV